MNYRMLVSNLYHLAHYSIAKPKNSFEKAAIIFSLDIDVGDKRLAALNGGKYNANIHHYLSEYQVGEIEEWAMPLFLNAFDEYEIPATFAIRGQLGELDLRINDIFGLKQSMT